MSLDTNGSERVAIAERVSKSLPRRRRSEAFFRGYGIAAIAIAITFLTILVTSILSTGLPAFQQTHIRVTVDFAEDMIAPIGTTDRDTIYKGKWRQIARQSIAERFDIDVSDRQVRRQGQDMFTSFLHYELRDLAVRNPELIGTKTDVWMPAHSNVDQLIKGNISRDVPESRRQVNDQQIAWVDELTASGDLELQLNRYLLTRGASSNPEIAGLRVALIGSAYMMGVVLMLALPLGVAAAIYLEEFAPKNWFVDLIEVNINNLAAVPSIVFGILGLSLFINFFGIPRGTPVVGGLVLTLMTLPTIIIATRAALRAVPPSIREAALGVGASKVQSVFHHVLPLSAPGILTGTIIGLAQALGETAPLLMLGLMAFIVEPPTGPMDTATALPVQVYLWSTYAERGFVERTSAAIIVLLVFMLTMNAVAIVLRRRFERRW